MNSKEINEILRFCLTKQQWGGIFASDNIPFDICRKCNFGIICNTETSEESGEHWIAIYMPREGHLEYFDSFGRYPHITNFISFLNPKINSFQYNDVQIQSNTGITCGHFCILFLLNLFMGVSFKEFISLFDIFNLKGNEAFAYDFVTSYANKILNCKYYNNTAEI